MKARQILIALTAALCSVSCIGVGPARKYDCRITPGYDAKAIDDSRFDITLYYASYWTKKVEANVLAKQATRLCGSQHYTLSETELGVQYLDGCFGPGDARGEKHFLLSCI